MQLRNRKKAAGGGEEGVLMEGVIDETRLRSLATPPPSAGIGPFRTDGSEHNRPSSNNTAKDGIRDRNVLMVGPNFRVGKKIGCGNFGELRLGESSACVYSVLNISL